MKQRLSTSPSLDIGPSGLSNARIAMMLVVASEVMLFSGLVAGYIVLRFGSGGFEGLPRLPIGLAGISTPLLVASSIALIISSRAWKRRDIPVYSSAALASLLLGVLFLALQLLEWEQLMNSGTIPSNNVYGGMFYALSWVHGLHVLGGLVLLGYLVRRAWRPAVTQSSGNFVAVVGIYWHFVTIVWGALFLMLFVF